MPNRTARIASVVVVNVLAGLLLSTIARGEPAAPDNCLSAPKGDAPAGSHWRYHVDHVNKRNCWYLRHEDGSVSQGLPQTSTAPSPPAKPSVADARAEFRPQAARENNTAANTPAGAAGTAASTSASEASPANASIWNTPPAAATAAPPVATRWPDIPAASTAPNAVPAAPAPASDTPQPSAESAKTVAPSAPVANLTAPLQPETIRTLIAGMLGALAFAGAAALIARRRSLGRRLRRRVAQSARGAIWETTDDDRIVLSDHPYPDHRDYRPRFARGVGAASVGSRKTETARRAPRYAQR